MLESGIGRAHNLHLSTLPGFTLPGDVAASRRYFVPDLIDPPIEVAPDGTIAVPPGAGHRRRLRCPNGARAATVHQERFVGVRLAVVMRSIARRRAGIWAHDRVQSVPAPAPVTPAPPRRRRPSPLDKKVAWIYRLEQQRTLATPVRTDSRRRSI
jgi:hypothetical protein